MDVNSQWGYLIVNADDYGYFNCISRGILQSANQGIVTAAGIFANSNNFDEQISWLQEYPELDVGVHLNLTNGYPLTNTFRRCQAQNKEAFIDKYNIVKALLLGQITLETVACEWRAQIEHCQKKGLVLRFLNSHEHIHMLPPLFKLTLKLAKEYDIAHVRLTSPKGLWNYSLGGLVRDTTLLFLSELNKRYLSNTVTPKFIGLEKSGKLNFEYLKNSLSNLIPGQVYELMCHPGLFDKNEIVNPKLTSYHDWESELRALTDPRLKEFLSNSKIRIIGYRHLLADQCRLPIETQE